MLSDADYLDMPSPTTVDKKANMAADNKLTFWFHADSQALVISTRLANVASFECYRATATM